MFELVTVGHFSIDFIKLPCRSITKPTLGGPPTYVSLAAKNLGTEVSVISKVGKDFPPKWSKWLRKQGVDLSGLTKVDSDLTTSYVLDYSEGGERRLFLRNKAPMIAGNDIPDSFEARAVHIAPIANEVTNHVVSKIRERASVVSMDPQGFLRHFKENGEVYIQPIENLRILAQVDIYKASLAETRALAAKTDLPQAIKAVSRQGVKIVIITRGTEGSTLYTGGKVHLIPPAKPRVVADTTGSGDVFIGAFLAEYIREKDPLWCASVGSAAASLVIEKIGPRGFGSTKEVYDRAAQVHDRII